MTIELQNTVYKFETDDGWKFYIAYAETSDIQAAGGICHYTGACEASMFDAWVTTGVPMGSDPPYPGMRYVGGRHTVKDTNLYIEPSGNPNGRSVNLYAGNVIAWLGGADPTRPAVPQITVPLIIKDRVSGTLYAAVMWLYLSSGAWFNAYERYIAAVAPKTAGAATPGYVVIDSDLWPEVDSFTGDVTVTQLLTSRALADFLSGHTPEPVNPPDPYTPGGESTTGGGDGTFDDTSVAVPIPGLPAISAVDTKFISLFNPTLTELQALASYMWSSFDLNTFRKLFADPMDCILGLSIVPVAVPDGGQAEVTVGNIGTGVYMNRAGAQYLAVDCGSITVERYWGAYLDYAPYTRAEIYLPYIGAHALAMDDIMGKSIHVAYHIDILSGACAAFLECDGTVLYTFTGQCSSSIPISGNDFTSVINGILGAACAVGSTVLSGGAAAPAAVSSIASLATNVMKPTVEKSGAMAGTGGMLSVQVPYLILTRPRQAIPGGQNIEMGYPAFITRQLGELAGYTEVESVHLTGIPCTSQELIEIENALKEGVIL